MQRSQAEILAQKEANRARLEEIKKKRELDAAKREEMRINEEEAKKKQEEMLAEMKGKQAGGIKKKSRMFK